MVHQQTTCENPTDDRTNKGLIIVMGESVCIVLPGLSGTEVYGKDRRLFYLEKWLSTSACAKLSHSSVLIILKGPAIVCEL